MILRLPKAVIILSLVSLLNDAASEMITPLLPLFLTAIMGTGPTVVGLVEGVAEATASLLKLVSGRLADRGWRHKPLVLAGYTLSNGARPLIGLATSWPWVLGLRFADRIGKGIRTAPRDAIIAHSTSPHLLGRAFGLHRALDNAGAIIGPLVAFWLLQQNVPMQHIFLWSILPGLGVLSLLALGLDEVPPPPSHPLPPLRWRVLPPSLQGLILASGGLALASAPEVFLILWATERGMEIAWTPLLWAAASAVKTLIALMGGELSDKLGRLPILLLGWSGRIGVLIALALAEDGALLTWGLFLGYSAALAFTEGPERALVGDMAEKRLKATVFGLYHMTVGLAALPGAVLFGFLWENWSSTMAFMTAAAITTLSALTLIVMASRSR